MEIFLKIRLSATVLHTYKMLSEVKVQYSWIHTIVWNKSVKLQVFSKIHLEVFWLFGLFFLIWLLNGPWIIRYFLKLFCFLNCPQTILWSYIRLLKRFPLQSALQVSDSRSLFIRHKRQLLNLWKARLHKFNNQDALLRMHLLAKHHLCFVSVFALISLTFFLSLCTDWLSACPLRNFAPLTELL